ncbi:MAG: hypothetical protein WCC87_08680 [Candidatus Korobacteraceae bacterium]
MSAWKNLWASLVFLFALFVCSATAQDTRINATPNGYINPPQPAVDHAFVRDGRGILVADDLLYALDVAAFANPGRRYKSADVVMQQCHGGGFLKSLALFGPASHTFSSAARWDQPAWNVDDVAVKNPSLDNFTRSWRDSALTFVPEKMVGLFLDTIGGSPFVVRDPYSFLGAQFTCRPPFINTGRCEFPQYQSPDIPLGVNDLRDLGDLKVPQIGRQYVILVAWDTPDPRHAVNILRLYQTLTTLYNVPKGHIAVLYGNPAPLIISGPKVIVGGGSGRKDPALLPKVRVNGPNNLFNWFLALSGRFFTDNNLPYKPRPGDRLLIYNTGHGGHTNNVLGRGVPIGPGIQFKLTITSGFQGSLSGNQVSDTSIADLSPDGTFTDSFQLTFADPVPAGTQLYVDGQLAGTFGSGAGDIQTTTNPLPVGAPPGSVAYQFTIPVSFLESSPDTVTLGFSASGNAISLLNVDLRGGDQELLAEPCGQPECQPY